jgi:hypothetical protein
VISVDYSRKRGLVMSAFFNDAEGSSPLEGPRLLIVPFEEAGARSVRAASSTAMF